VVEAKVLIHLQVRVEKVVELVDKLLLLLVVLMGIIMHNLIQLHHFLGQVITLEVVEVVHHPAVMLGVQVDLV